MEAFFMHESNNVATPKVPEPHPLKPKILFNIIPYWKRAKISARPEAWRNHALNGIIKMPPDTAEKLAAVLAALEGGQY